MGDVTHSVPIAPLQAMYDVDALAVVKQRFVLVLMAVCLVVWLRLTGGGGRTQAQTRADVVGPTLVVRAACEVTVLPARVPHRPIRAQAPVRVASVKN